MGSIDDYCLADRRWSLVKLHGSVNWGRAVKNATERSTAALGILNSVDGEVELESEIRVLAGHQDGQRVLKHVLYYPALAVPIEGKTEFVCPDQHVTFLSELLPASSDFLIIGFSANDAHVLRLLAVVSGVNKLMIANGNLEAAVKAESLIAKHNESFGINNAGFDGGFGKLAQSGFADFLD